MSIALILLQQILLMFLLTGIGYLMFACKKISSEGAKTLANILLYLSLPCVIIKSFLTEQSAGSIIGLLVSAAAALLLLVVSIFVSHLCFRRDAVAEFAAAFSNPGFFGIPLIAACIGDGAVFYVAAFIAFLNLFQWTYGVSVLTKEKGRITLKKILTAPFMIAIIIGLFFSLSNVSMPSLLLQCINFLAGLNTPLAMFTIGIYLAQTNICSMLKKRSLYRISAVRLVFIPLLALGLLSFLPAEFSDLKIAVLIAAACPVGSNVAVYAQLHNKDYPYAVETVVISTLFSLISIPLLLQFAQLLWQ